MSEKDGGFSSDVADPFQDIKLSEVVAQLLESDSTDDVYTEEYEVTGDEKEDEKCEHYISFINYKEEPRNMDLFREPLKTIEEEGSLSNISGATSSEYLDLKFIDESVNNSRIDLRSTTDEYPPTKSDYVYSDNNTCMTNVTDKGVETEFGVNQTLRSDKAQSDVNVGDVQAPIRDVNFRWSVTSV